MWMTLPISLNIEFHNLFYFLFLKSDSRAMISNIAFKNFCKAYVSYHFRDEIGAKSKIRFIHCS